MWKLVFLPNHLLYLKGNESNMLSFQGAYFDPNMFPDGVAKKKDEKIDSRLVVDRFFTLACIAINVYLGIYLGYYFMVDKSYSMQ